MMRVFRTVSSDVSDTRYSGNGSTTAFATGFTFYANTSLVVSLINTTTGVETVKTLTTDYSVTGGNGATGTVTFVVAPATGYTVVLKRNEPYTQETDLVDGDPLPSSVLEGEFDKIVMQVQQVFRRTQTAIQAPASFNPTTTSAYTMPVPANGEVPVGNAAGTGWDSTPIAGLSSTTVPSVITAVADQDLLSYDGGGSVWRNYSLATILKRILTTAGDLLVNISGTVQRLALGASGQVLAVSGGSPAWVTPTIPRGHLAGCTLSTAGSSSTMSVAAGQAADSTNTYLMALAAIAKTTGAWAAGTGNGGLDTGTIANSTWYHFYVIKDVTNNLIDVVFSTSASAPSLPTGYTLYRRIGSGKTDGSGHWISFVQKGDTFLWSTQVNDVASGTITANTSKNFPLSVPTGINVLARFNGACQPGAVQAVVFYSPLSATINTPGSGQENLYAVVGSSGNGGAGQYAIITDTSGNISATSGSAVNPLYIWTVGWDDRRGKDD